MDEQQFLNEINAIPWEQPAGNDEYRNALLVFADWLEERGDPRVELIRLRELLLIEHIQSEEKISEERPKWSQSVFNTITSMFRKPMVQPGVGRALWEPRMQKLIHQGVQPVVATWENSIGMKFCWCPPGTFLMGNLKNEVDGCEIEDQVEVTLTQGFWLRKYEVTQGEWEKVIGTKPWSGKLYSREGATFAASYVSWEDAVAYCQQLTEQERSAGRLPEGWECRLPTEAQWEYSCRAGTTTAYCFGNDVAGLGEYAWYSELTLLKGENFPHEVGQKRCNAWGLHDMHGNVAEWCQDWLTPKLAGGTDPTGATTGSGRVLRGRHLLDYGGTCQSAYRFSSPLGKRLHCFGVRAAIVPLSK